MKTINLTKKQRKRIEKAILMWDNLPLNQWDQHEWLIDIRTMNPCGCFGFHMARIFRIKKKSHGVMKWCFKTFSHKMPSLLGIREEDLAYHGSSRCPFSSDPWPDHPSDVLRGILREADG